MSRNSGSQTRCYSLQFVVNILKYTVWRWQPTECSTFSRLPFMAVGERECDGEDKLIALLRFGLKSRLYSLRVD